MKHLRKQADLNIRLSKDERRRVNKAARKVSEERREIVGPTTLSREIIMREVDRILAEPAEAVAAAS